MKNTIITKSIIEEWGSDFIQQIALPSNTEKDEDILYEAASAIWEQGEHVTDC